MSFELSANSDYLVRSFRNLRLKPYSQNDSFSSGGRLPTAVGQHVGRTGQTFPAASDFGHPYLDQDPAHAGGAHLGEGSLLRAGHPPLKRGLR
jgi:hypothetical protein